MRLRVSSIDPSINKIRLQEIFEEHGDVVSVKIFRSLDGLTPTLGFVEMKRDREAEAALKALNGLVIGDTAMKVELSNDMVKSHNKPVSPPIDEDEEEDDYDEEDEGQIKEIPLHELDEEI
ncbi:MAG: RNA-binding protein [Bacteroidia bacterium]|nr:RNA-binding protein [Bacteroidia bacterium]